MSAPAAPPVLTNEVATTAVVDAPSGLAGFVLVMRLHDYRAQNKQAEDGSWHVHVALTGDAAARALSSAVEQWLRSEGIAATTLHIGGEARRVTASPLPKV